MFIVKNIIVICTGNSCRSQMAEGWLKYLNPNLNIYSAGVNPEKVNKYAIKVMNEVGIDISKNSSNNIQEYKNMTFDYVITVCDNAKKNCPILIGDHKQIHYNFPDPAKERGEDDYLIKKYSEVRDMIKEFLIDFCSERGLDKIY